MRVLDVLGKAPLHVAVKQVGVLPADEAVLARVVLDGLLLVAKLREGVDDDTEHDVEDDHHDDQEEGEVELRRATVAASAGAASRGETWSLNATGTHNVTGRRRSREAVGGWQFPGGWGHITGSWQSTVGRRQLPVSWWLETSSWQSTVSSRQAVGSQPSAVGSYPAVGGSSPAVGSQPSGFIIPHYTATVEGEASKWIHNPRCLGVPTLGEEVAQPNRRVTVMSPQPPGNCRPPTVDCQLR